MFRSIVSFKCFPPGKRYFWLDVTNTRTLPLAQTRVVCLSCSAREHQHTEDLVHYAGAIGRPPYVDE